MDVSDLINHVFGFQGLSIKTWFYCLDFQSLKIFATKERHQDGCKSCQFPQLLNHGWRTKTIQVPPLGIFNHVLIEIKFERLKCPQCGCVQSSRPKSGIHKKFDEFSTSFVETAGRLLEETTCAAASRLLCANSKTLWSMDNYRTKELKKHFTLPSDLDVTRLSADEVHFRTIDNTTREHPFAQRWMTKFITNLVATNPGKIIANASGREGMSLKKCLLELSKEQRLRVEFFALDMHASFMKVAKKMCPHADLCVDRFHLVQMLNKSFDEVRREEFIKAKKSHNEFQESMLSATKRFILMERNAPLSIEEQNLLGKLRALNDTIHNAMLITDYFHKVLDKTGVIDFRKSLAQWYGLVRQAKIKPLRKFAGLVRKYRINIENYIKSQLTTAISEGLNNKIRVLKAMGYGYTNEQAFMNKILQRCGFLNSKMMDTTPLYWSSELGTNPVHH